MEYYLTRVIHSTFEEAIARVTEELKHEGFGILTEIDVKETLKKKLGVEFRNYKIFGACNPPFAYQAFQAEDKIGILLPCNVIIQEKGEGLVEVSTINPLETMTHIGNNKIIEIANQIYLKLKKVLETL